MSACWRSQPTEQEEEQVSFITSQHHHTDYIHNAAAVRLNTAQYNSPKTTILSSFTPMTCHTWCVFNSLRVPPVSFASGSIPSTHKCLRSERRNTSLHPSPWLNTEWFAGPLSFQISLVLASVHFHTMSRTIMNKNNCWKNSDSERRTVIEFFLCFLSRHIVPLWCRAESVSVFC